MDREKYYKAAENTARLMSKITKSPIFLGGDHSITAATINGIFKAIDSPMRLICFDTHCDIGVLGVKVLNYSNLTHANILSYLFDLGLVAEVWVVGVRSFVPCEAIPFPKSLKCIDSLKSNLISEKSMPTYVSVDLDVLDPIIFPSVGHPEPGGFTIQELCKDLEWIFHTLNVVGLDLVEANYNDQYNENTGRIISSILMKCLRTICSPKNKELSLHA